MKSRYSESRADYVKTIYYGKRETLFHTLPGWQSKLGAFMGILFLILIEMGSSEYALSDLRWGLLHVSAEHLTERRERHYPSWSDELHYISNESESTRSNHSLIYLHVHFYFPFLITLSQPFYLIFCHPLLWFLSLAFLSLFFTLLLSISFTFSPLCFPLFISRYSALRILKKGNNETGVLKVRKSHLPFFPCVMFFPHFLCVLSRLAWRSWWP